MIRPAAIALLLAGLALPALAFPALAGPAEDLARLDIDHDGVLDREEAHYDGHALWNVVSPEWWLQTEYLHSGEATLKEGELAGRVEGADYARINLNSDHGIDMAEWQQAVDRRFDAADANGDGKVDAAELAAPAGLRLLQVLE